MQKQIFKKISASGTEENFLQWGVKVPRRTSYDEVLKYPGELLTRCYTVSYKNYINCFELRDSYFCLKLFSLEYSYAAWLLGLLYLSNIHQWQFIITLGIDKQGKNRQHHPQSHAACRSHSSKKWTERVNEKNKLSSAKYSCGWKMSI